MLPTIMPASWPSLNPLSESEAPELDGSEDEDIEELMLLSVVEEDASEVEEESESESELESEDRDEKIAVVLPSGRVERNPVAVVGVPSRVAVVVTG